MSHVNFAEDEKVGARKPVFVRWTDERSKSDHWNTPLRFCELQRFAVKAGRLFKTFFRKQFVALSFTVGF